jgi:hypothetical protein
MVISFLYKKILERQSIRLEHGEKKPGAKAPGGIHAARTDD